MGHFKNESGELTASVEPDIFGKGFLVHIWLKHPRTKGMHRTPVKYRAETRRSANAFAKKLLEKGVWLS